MVKDHKTMNSRQTKVAVTIGVGVLLLAGLVAIVLWKNSTPEAKIAKTVEKIKEVNVGLPDPQVQAKTLIFAAMIQKQIPAAANWCDTLNAGGKLWPITPTNTTFALNAKIAGRPYSRTAMPPGDVVVFFETATAGWNQSGGAELLAERAEGVAVAFADGRSMIVSPAEAAQLRWAP